MHAVNAKQFRKQFSSGLRVAKGDVVKTFSRACLILA